QYWGYANTATGSYSITGVQPGTYTETLYDNELEVGTRTVTVSAGVNTSANIANTYYTPPAPIFRIGTWDGTPLGFLNADKIETEHPSDIRMSDWNSTPNFVVGTNTDAQWPLAQFMGVNNSQRITFNLTAAQVQSMSLRIGITWGFSGARPKVTVNSGQTYAWTSANPSASSDLNSRGITRGTWRGDNQLYTFSIPSTAFRAGTNTIDVPLISGSFTAGQTWLSPNVAYDAIDLVPSTATAPAIASVTITPSGSTTGVNGTKTFTAVAKDANGNVITANIDWSAARGTIDANGNYVAPATAGSDTITATANTTKTPGYNTTSSSTSAFTGTITGSGSTTISVLSATPSVVTAASASPSPVYGKTTTLSALGTDLTGESNLTYTWSVLGTPPAAVTFSAANGTNAGKSTLATFTQPGDYTFRVTITNGSNLSATSDVTVTVFDKKVWYKVDASSGTTLTDSSGSNNTATLTGSYAYAAGVDGNAIKFTGGSASLPTGVVSTLNDFTIGAWIKPDASQSWSRVFDFGTGTTAYMFFTPRTSTGVSRFAIKSATGSEQTIDGPALAVGAWTHVAVTLSGNLATLYINGVAVGTNAGLTTHPAALGNTANNYLGKSQFAADPALLASVDDFRLYGSGLSASAISTWYSAAGTPATVTGFTTDDGSSQRSMVRSFTLTFDKAVTLPAGALTLLVNGVASPASLIVTATSSANTQYLVTFSNTGAAGGSLADGSYQLTLNGALITSGAGRPMASNSNYTFYRLFGDSDGNGVVDFNDFLNLQNSFGQSVGSPTFAASLDGDGNGTVDFNDFLMLQNNFGKTMTAARPIVVAVKKTTPVKLVRR
ncbi:MAG: polysaccharide lyase family 4 protein, partial [Phycisphaerales bacterium]|nr:polysaccharide lyase family 4 protein [Phycisphaerales bacterium]